SKKEVYDLIPTAYYPATLFFKAGTPFREVQEHIHARGFTYPLIAKPDIGRQGLSVLKAGNEEALAQYIATSRVNFLIQEFVPYNNEVGIFYYRYPWESRGHISGIVKKELLTVVGDGVATMEELLYKNKRYVLQLAALRRTYGDQLKKILPAGEEHI